MKPIQLMVALFVVNIIFITGVVYAVSPKADVPFEIQQVSIQQPDNTKPEFLTGTPKRIIIPAKNLSVSIAEGTYSPTTKQWTLGDKTAHHALITPKPNNQAGNTFIYGHNKKEVFGSIIDLEVGSEAIIETKEEISFRYVLRSVRDVEPSDVSLFEYEGSPILTVQTCSGSWYEQRRLFTFEMMEATK